ncbi:hypothetical protein CsSME_00021649 [Camellia sinensis var. sinensis]
MFSSLPNMPSTTSVLSTYTTFTASAMLVRSVLNEVQSITCQLIPKQLQEKIISKLGGPIGYSSSQMTLYIDESNNGQPINQMFEASEIYLHAKISPSVERLKVFKAPGQKHIDRFWCLRILIAAETFRTDKLEETTMVTSK